MVVVDACEARLQPSKLVPGADLGDGQSNRGPMADIVKSNLLSMHRDILEAIHRQVTLGVQSPGGVVRCQLEGLQLLHQGYNKEIKDHQEEHNGENDRRVRFFLRILPMTLALDSTSRTRAVVLSPSTVAWAAWEVFKVASRRLVLRVASQ